MENPVLAFGIGTLAEAEGKSVSPEVGKSGIMGFTFELSDFRTSRLLIHTPLLKNRFSGGQIGILTFKKWKEQEQYSLRDI